MKNEEIIRIAVKRWSEARDSDQEERRLIDEDTRFAIDDEGCQWPADVRAARENDSPPRPVITINKIPEKIDQVEGEFRQLSPQAKIRAVDNFADPKIATVCAGLLRHIEYGSNAKHKVYTPAHVSTLVAGRGAWRIDIEEDDDDPFVKNIKLNPIKNVLTVYGDPEGDWCIVTEEINKDKFEMLWPNADIQDWMSDTEVIEDWRTDETVRVAEYWWKEPIKKKFLKVSRTREDGARNIFTIEESQYETRSQPGDEVVEEKEVKRNQVKWGIMTAGGFVEGPYDDWPISDIPIIMEKGKEVNVSGQSKTRGMVRFAKSPMQMYHFWSTATTEAVALAPKAPYLVTPTMIAKFQSQWDQAPNKNFFYLLFEPDAKSPGGPRREPAPQLSSAYANEMMRMEHDIMSAMGIYNASLGDQGDEKSGKAIIARQRQGSIGSFPFTDRFGEALTRSTKIILKLMPFVYDTERVIRILGEDGVEKIVPINASPNGQAMQQVKGQVREGDLSFNPEVSEYINDITVGKYDVVVTIGPSYNTQRQETAAMLLDLIASVPQIGIAAAPILIKNLDIPGSEELLKIVKKMIPPGIRELDAGEDPPEEKTDPKLMLEMQKMMIAMKKENREEFTAQVNAIKTLAEAEAKERGQQLAQFDAVMKQMREQTGVLNEPQRNGR